MARTIDNSVAVEATAMVRGLGLVDSTTMVMGSMIGSGIFIVSADIARQVQYPGLLLAVWIFTGILTIMGALCYGELAGAMPNVGGQYVYLKEAYNPLLGFLYGWTLFAVIQAGFVAAVAVAFAKYFGIFAPWVSETRVLVGLGPLQITSQQLVAIASIVLLTYLNTRGLKMGAMIQNIFTFAKVSALIGLIVAGLFVAGAASSENSTPFMPPTFNLSLLTLIGVAMVGSLFSSDAWNNITFTAGEVKDPRKTIPLALALGTASVSFLYVMANVIYIKVLGIQQIATAPEDRVGAMAALAIMGAVGLTLITAAILISTFGCNNGLVLAGARVYYAMAQDGLFFKKMAKLDPATHVPAVSLWVQCLWASALTLSGTYGQLLDYSVFAALLFYVLTVIGLFILRKKRAGLERPYKCVGYPWMPALYVLSAFLITVIWLATKDRSWWGLVMVLTGIPIYYIWKGFPGSRKL